jgi:large repetitive protein
VDVAVKGDDRIETTEHFGVVLTSPVGLAIDDPVGVGTIGSDDLILSTLLVDDVTVTEGHAGTTAATFTVSRVGYLDSVSTVSVSTVNGTATAPSDYAAVAPTTLTFAPGEETKTVTVGIVGDTVREGNERFNVRLSGALGTIVVDDTARGTIRNDD